MKTILRVPTPNGDVDVEVDINESEFARLAAAGFAQVMTPAGYGRVAKYNYYYYVASDGVAEERIEKRDESDLALYIAANYYSSKELAENNARADKLMRQLRRFAVEHREYEINWNDRTQLKWYVLYDYNNNELYASSSHVCSVLGITYFNSKEVAQAAIETFHNELIWYFTEYKDSL